MGHLKYLNTCEQCGQEFHPYHRNQRFCCQRCMGDARSHKQAITCAACGKEFLRSPSHIKSVMAYCSVACKSKHSSVSTTCFTCGKDIKQPKSQADAFQYHYCSPQCRNEGQKSRKPWLTCDWCGDSFQRYPSEIRKAAERGTRFVFCGHPCRAAMIAAQFNPPRPYNGEHTSGPRNAAQSREWRKAVLARDGYTCQECGATDKMLNAHHIRPSAIYPAERYDLTNGITYCYECHTTKHSLPAEEAPDLLGCVGQ